MFSRFVLYPEALEKLNKSGIISRFDSKKDEIPIELKYAHNHSGLTFSDYLEHMIGEGYFNLKGSSDEQSNVLRKLNEPLKEQGGRTWKRIIGKKKLEGMLDLESFSEPEDELAVMGGMDESELLVLSGWHASHLLSPEEIWAYREFGFESFFELTGTVGAFIAENLGFDSDEGGEYTYETELGELFQMEVTGDHNYDLRIFRTNITNHPIVDPFGNKVLYRPIFRGEGSGIYPYHSCEPVLLKTILKWADQENLPSGIINDGGKSFLEETGQWTGRLGNAADAGSNMTSLFQVFMGYEDPIRLFEGEHRTGYFLVDISHGAYGAFISPDKNLVFYHMNDKHEWNKKPSLMIYKGEVDLFIRALFTQAANGKGRTSLNEMRRCLEYGLSGKYEERIKEMGSHRTK